MDITLVTKKLTRFLKNLPIAMYLTSEVRTSRPSLSRGQERILDNRLRQSNLMRKLSKSGVD